jgi:hypothetical protein
MISYKLESNLSPSALQVMEESIPPLLVILTDIVEESSSVEEVIMLTQIRVPFTVNFWLRDDYVPENEIWIRLSNTGAASCKMVIDAKSIYRDYQLKKLLE